LVYVFKSSVKGLVKIGILNPKSSGGGASSLLRENCILILNAHLPPSQLTCKQSLSAHHLCPKSSPAMHTRPLWGSQLVTLGGSSRGRSRGADPAYPATKLPEVIGSFPKNISLRHKKAPQIDDLQGFFDKYGSDYWDRSNDNNAN